MPLGENIFNLRLARGMSQEELAELLGVSRQSISKWETGASVPELDKLIKMSELFEISIDNLVKGDETYSKPQSQTEAVPEPEQIPQKSTDTAVRQLQPRHIVGIIFIAVYLVAVIFGLFLLNAGGLLVAAVFLSPVLLWGIICLIFKKRIVLWCGWAFCVPAIIYLRITTGIRLHWIFSSDIYTPRLASHAIIAWAMVVALVLLIVFTVLSFWKFKKK
ncbi:MAG: helix-turn-helix transcriptional regulator [Oscillospiraceae bacterium]|nr:helix-turn-helix transcriptional regulator [Oscillospiraceae bacterium]